MFGSGIPNGNLIEKFLFLFQNGIDGHGGGAVSGIFGLPLLYWFGPPTGAKVTMVLLIFVVTMVLTGGTLIGLYQSAKKPMKKMEEVYVAHSEIRNQQRQERMEQMEQEGQSRPRFNINIPLKWQAIPHGSKTPPFSADRFLNAKRKKEEELEQLRQQQQQQTQKDRASWREKASRERAEQKQKEEQRAKELQIPRSEREEEEAEFREHLPAEDEDNSSIDSPFLDDLIHRVTNPAPPLAKQDRDVLNTLKSNMASPQVRAVADSGLCPSGN